MTEPYPIRPITPDEFDAFHLVDQHAFHGGPMTRGQRRQIAVAAGARPDPGRVRRQHAGRHRRRVQLPHAPARRDGPGGRGELGRRAPLAPPPGHPERLMRRQLATSATGARRWPCCWPRRRDLRPVRLRPRVLADCSPSGAAREGWPRLPADPALRLRIAEPGRPTPRWARSTNGAGDPPGFLRPERTVVEPAAPRPRQTGGRSSPMRCVLAEDDAGPRGYALYTCEGRWDEDRSCRTANWTSVNWSPWTRRQRRTVGRPAQPGPGHHVPAASGRWTTRCSTCWPIRGGCGRWLPTDCGSGSRTCPRR